MTQAQPNLLELAKQGNAKALAKRARVAQIAALMNRQLPPKSITAKAIHKYGRLRVILASVHISGSNPASTY